jgi:hypothetical protein
MMRVKVLPERGPEYLSPVSGNANLKELPVADQVHEISDGFISTTPLWVSLHVIDQIHVLAALIWMVTAATSYVEVSLWMMV